MAASQSKRSRMNASAFRSRRRTRISRQRLSCVQDSLASGPFDSPGTGQRLGLYGFGAAAHIICQVAVAQGRRVFAFTRAGDAAGQSSRASLGAEWAGPSSESPPEELDAAIIFAPVGRPRASRAAPLSAREALWYALAST